VRQSGGISEDSSFASARRAITADTAMRFARYFGTTAGIWMRLQTQYALEVAERAYGEEIKKNVVELSTKG
jgi:plasmid maintenance system antidote protein VapI